MRDLSCATVTTCLAAGDSGSIVFTEDAGATWVVGSIGATATMAGVSCPTSRRCFDLASSGEVFDTRDRGRSWQLVQSDTAPPMLSLHSATTRNAGRRRGHTQMIRRG